ncbi:hypothetical protein [Desnuesiella massiliensis]|uniref:hypothetical protein n=1 Tax=Desnuesiella massiliensis TaxID=1650662 RepID=UPI0006E362F1|nr:hypothetical protein [Desnuesiella massiliensis]
MKSYNCKKINHNITIDGLLDKEEWQGVKAITLIEVMIGSKVRLETEVKAMYSNDYIYFAFRCADDYIKATMTKSVIGI